MMAHYLAMNHKAYKAYTGIVKEDTEETISCVGYIGKVGMHQTDKEIIKMMLDTQTEQENGKMGANPEQGKQENNTIEFGEYPVNPGHTL